MREQEYRVPRAHGPKVAVIGGGHGLSNMLRGLKQYTENISAIVTVADDGGGSGMLRQDLGMPPPGDIRSCMEALANTEPVMRELLHYRFTEGSLAGQSFGNLFLAALNGISPSFDAAVRRMSQVLAITGRVLPVTTADVQLEAEFENGATVVGESKIFYCKKQEDCRIRQVRLIPSRPKALPEAVSAIADADMIVLGPGSLYTIHLDIRAYSLYGKSYARNKSATAHRHYHRFHIGHFVKDFKPYRSLSGYNQRIVKRMHKRVAVLVTQFKRTLVSVVINSRNKAYIGPIFLGCLDLAYRSTFR